MEAAMDVHNGCSEDVLYHLDNLHDIDNDEDNMSCISQEVLCNLVEIDIPSSHGSIFQVVEGQRLSVVHSGCTELQPGDVVVALNDSTIDHSNVYDALHSLRVPGKETFRARILKGLSTPSPELRESTDSDRDSGTLEDRCYGYYHAAVAAFEEKKYQCAIENGEKALECGHICNEFTADCHLLIAQCHEAIGDDNISVKHLKCAVALLRSSFDDYHLKLLPAIEHLFRIYSQHRKTSIAEKYGRWMITLLNRNDLHQSVLMANALSHMATLSWTSQQYEKAIQTQTEALRMRMGLQGKRHRDVAMALHMLASIRHDMGDMSCQTEDMYLKALQLLSSAENYNAVNYAAVLGSMAAFYNRKGQYAHALKLKRQEVRILEQYDVASYVTAKAQWGLAGLLCAAGVDRDASEYRRKTIHTLTQLYGATHSRVVRYVAEDERICSRRVDA